VTQFGHTMMCEQSRPDQLVEDVKRAEQAGFDFSVISDHFQPWLSTQGHSGYALSILGAAAHATERIGLMSYVTCPTLRYHPAIVAVDAHVEAIKPFTEAGFDEVALLQIGAEHQEQFTTWAERELLPALRSI
jgi:Luciferase-like monooxygenase